MDQTLVTYSAAERIWSGPPRNSIYKDDTAFGVVIFQSMKNWPKNICQIWDDEGVAVTFEEALTWAIRIAQFFKRRELNHKNIIGIAAGHSKYLLSLAVACLMNGTPFHAPHSVLDEATLRYVFSITKPNLIFCDGKDFEKVKAATIEWQPEIYTLTDHVEGVPNIESLLEPTTTEMSYQPEPLVDGCDQTVALLCSSGTTGLPKVVCIENRRLLHFLIPPINSESIVFQATAIDWLGGIALLIFNTTLGCTRILSRNPFTSEYIVHLVRKYKIDILALAPLPFTALVNCPDATAEALSSIRQVFYVGGSIALTTIQKGQKLMGNASIGTVYASTEATSITAIYKIEKGNPMGKPVAGVKIRIVGENGENLTYNQVGEILVHNGLTWQGYYGNPEATRESQDSEGWHHTGDMGYFNEDNLLYMVDRCKDILKYEAMHYWPGEIEAVILELPQVQNVCVVGIRDELENDAAGALVVLKKGSTISAKEIVEHVVKKLPPVHKQLHAGVQFTNELPTNPNGKVVRKRAIGMFNALKAA
ncbi:4-coumarate--CoA ligase 1-like [Drosophila serrata]|uniref:4-coumarate--CoA ligase 1-like n=1 Tax=Drosophila serrata TaxID=7274 RepID=UPI000A1D2940|nr:4-coumarate--CoA ligase 1-like [Drosophila serrata]